MIFSLINKWHQKAQCLASSQPKWKWKWVKEWECEWGVRVKEWKWVSESESQRVKVMNKSGWMKVNETVSESERVRVSEPEWVRMSKSEWESERE